MICPNCGHQNLPDARFCQNCGAELTVSSENSKSPASDLVTRPLSSVVADQHERNTLPATQPLPNLDDTFAPLPVGALLQQRYVVREVESTGKQLNVYRADDLIPGRQCPRCGMTASDPQAQKCTVCNTNIAGIPVKNLRYRIQESVDSQAFDIETTWLKMELRHPGLLLPIATFVESPYGPMRSYRALPELSLPAATTLTLPQEVNTVLSWGATLARALSYLHKNAIVMRAINLSHIVIAGDRALWSNLNRAYIVSPQEMETAGDAFARDVQALASTLLYLATGHQQLDAEALLPKRVQDLLAWAITRPQELTASTFAVRLNEVLQELRHPDSVTLVVGYRSDVGQSRSLNEDSLLTLDVARVYRSLNQPVGLFVVADGMGGHQAGDVASQLACATLAQLATHEIIEPAAAGQPLPDAMAWLTHAVNAANQAVYDQRMEAGTDMGTTLVMAFLIGDRAAIANVGDSRCYYLTPDGINRITTDHSLVERLVLTGQITEEEAAHHPQKNVIYRVIGDKVKLDVDLYEQRLALGDALLLCSDGLSGMLSDQDLWEIWHESNSPQEACDRLVEAANHAGGSDNITVIIVQVA